MQDRGGRDVVGVMGAIEQRRHLQGMEHERRAVGDAPLVQVTAARELERIRGQREVLEERELRNAVGSHAQRLPTDA